MVITQDLKENEGVLGLFLDIINSEYKRPIPHREVITGPTDVPRM